MDISKLDGLDGWRRMLVQVPASEDSYKEPIDRLGAKCIVFFFSRVAIERRSKQYREISRQQDLARETTVWAICGQRSRLFFFKQHQGLGSGRLYQMILVVALANYLTSQTTKLTN
jgi:hypothetical protein